MNFYPQGQIFKVKEGQTFDASFAPLKNVLGYHILLVGRPRQGQDAIPVSRSPGQGQGHSGRWRFWSIFHIFVNSSFSFDRIELGVHRYKEDDHMQKSVGAEF